MLHHLESFLKASMLALVTAAFLAVPARADEVIMKNGSRLIGKAVSMKSGKLVFETSFAGKITIDWQQVVQLTTEKPIEISHDDDKIVKGKAVESDEGTMVLQPETGPATEPITMAEVKTLQPPKPLPGAPGGRVGPGTGHRLHPSQFGLAHRAISRNVGD